MHPPRAQFKYQGEFVGTGLNCVLEPLLGILVATKVAQQSG
jgi:hypothetical protein